MRPARFDQLSSSYEELLRDPIRDRFSGQESLFFHQRKSELIRRFFRRRKIDTALLRYLDLGCGKGQLLKLLQPEFLHVAGCDVSAEMMEQITEIETRVLENPPLIPFEDSQFDLVTAVCVYHHISPGDRMELTLEVYRILRPGGVFCIIEHNPVNPITRLIVSRTPVDSDAVLLSAKEGRSLVVEAGLHAIEQEYFLYFPQRAYQYLRCIEPMLGKIPLGGQYAIFSEKTSPLTPG
jgi:SAM-dependent methyltransferase